jgi:hypothetical protein
MPANEIVNRDVAGGIFQLRGDANPPAVLQQWGLKPDTLERIAEGTYRVELEQGQSLEFDTATTTITEYSAIPVVAAVGPLSGAAILGVTLSTLVAPVDGTNEAPFLIVTVQDAAGALTDAPVFVAVLLKEAPER